MFFDCGSKPENPVRTAGTGRTCKLHIERSQTQEREATVLIRSNNRSVSAIFPHFTCKKLYFKMLLNPWTFYLQVYMESIELYCAYILFHVTIKANGTNWDCTNTLHMILFKFRSVLQQCVNCPALQQIFCSSHFTSNFIYFLLRINHCHIVAIQFCLLHKMYPLKVSLWIIAFLQYTKIYTI